MILQVYNINKQIGYCHFCFGHLCPILESKYFATREYYFLDYMIVSCFIQENDVMLSCWFTYYIADLRAIKCWISSLHLSLSHSNTNLILESMCYMWNATCPEFIHIKHKEAAVCISQVYGYKASTVDRGRLVDSSYTVSIISFLAMLTRRGFQSSKHRCVWSGPDYHYHVGITGYLRLKKGKWEAVLTHAVWCSSNWKESVLQYCEC